jgi:hypothetical protein
MDAGYFAAAADRMQGGLLAHCWPLAANPPPPDSVDRAEAAAQRVVAAALRRASEFTARGRHGLAHAVAEVALPPRHGDQTQSADMRWRRWRDERDHRITR